MVYASGSVRLDMSQSLSCCLYRNPKQGAYKKIRQSQLTATMALPKPTYDAELLNEARTQVFIDKLITYAELDIFTYFRSCEGRRK